LETLGETSSQASSDIDLCRQIVQTTPREYRFGWGSKDRRTYAARLLAKFSLWRDLPVRRLEISERAKPSAISILAEYQEGLTTVLVVTEQGSVVIVLPEDAPAEWKVSPSLWLPKDAEERADTKAPHQ
jgi:hypothetical protein